MVLLFMMFISSWYFVVHPSKNLFILGLLLSWFHQLIHELHTGYAWCCYRLPPTIMGMGSNSCNLVACRLCSFWQVIFQENMVCPLFIGQTSVCFNNAPWERKEMSGSVWFLTRHISVSSFLGWDKLPYMLPFETEAQIMLRIFGTLINRVHCTSSFKTEQKGHVAMKNQQK